MENQQKSSCISAIWAGIFLILLGGCDGPHIFDGNEVPLELRTAPRVVTTPSPEEIENTSWPRLGDVPSKPKNFTAQPLVDQTRLEMQNNRAEAERLRQQAEFPPARP
ncbi:MAG: hypothetical protein SFW62_04115 [Alphaproteobacteria bacterium]|nr:hypothetical protein [Alphaproteobacteria bacterium]